MSLLEEAVAQAASLEELEHRPWPLPPGPWLMGQSWRSLLFAHWRVPHDALRPHVPAPLELEERDGSAWLALTPFVLSGVRLHGVPPLLGLSRCCELNCRTYVRLGDRPGIWFFSLDASSPLVVAAARLSYRLPYRLAHVEAQGDGDRFAFRLRRARASGVSFRGEWTAHGEARVPAPGTLEHFLTERYCLYAGGGRFRAEIHHGPWRLRPAEARIEVEGIPPVALEGEPLCHVAERQDVVVWPLGRVR